MSDIYQESLEFHRKHGGKIEVTSKSPLETRKDLSLAYTPGVAEACREIGKDVSKAYEYTSKKNMVAIVTDGTAILGLGDLGPEAALPVMEGKAILFKEFGSVDAFPICLATKDVDTIVETVKLIAPSFGGINLEDISAPRCFEILKRLQEELDIPVMHDDQQGSAVVALAALINALKLVHKEKEQVKIVLGGAGAASIAITRLLHTYGFKNFILTDSKGVVEPCREDLNDIKKEMTAITHPGGSESCSHEKGEIVSLAEVMKDADVFIGASVAKTVTEDMVRSMAKDAIIIAMANPEPEIMPDLAHQAGAAIVATGRSDFPNQVNNVLAFPGIFRGVLDARLDKITDDMLVRAAEALASHITNPDKDHILPDPLDKTVAATIAQAIK